MPATRSGAGTPGEASAALSDGVAWVLFVLRPQRAGAQLGPRSSHAIARDSRATGARVTKQPGIAVHATLEHKDDPGDDEEKEKVEYCEDDEGGA
eukprot:CAMPEP_0182801928 /NCGR_PEP_ID=MMETSP0006_2-20121128/3210_1 /TAXON_ID=97485 /ORGANISM="Prymnesium parvum, Strain Texoma1" /LENGTH=94 /DNA_ID=CAMNT_0024927275 /DNA_START=640 /DNA_END=925 /DNA_ORIENTATION=+